MSTHPINKKDAPAMTAEQFAVDAGEIIERLKYATELKTDTELAALLGLSRTTISNWRKRNSVPLDRLLPICRKFAVPMDYLVTGRIGIDRKIPPPLDSELLGYLFSLLDRYGFIQLPNKGHADHDPARRAAAEFVELQHYTEELITKLMANDRMGIEEAKRVILSRPKKPNDKKGPQ